MIIQWNVLENVVSKMVTILSRPQCLNQLQRSTRNYDLFHMVQYIVYHMSLRWRHNGRDGVSNHQPHDCLLNRLFRRGSTKTSKLRVTGLCAGNSLGTGEFPAQMASIAENVSIWWRHHILFTFQNRKTWAPSQPTCILSSNRVGRDWWCKEFYWQNTTYGGRHHGTFGP